MYCFRVCCLGYNELSWKNEGLGSLRATKRYGVSHRWYIYVTGCSAALIFS